MRPFQRYCDTDRNNTSLFAVFCAPCSKNVGCVIAFQPFLRPFVPVDEKMPFVPGFSMYWPHSDRTKKGHKTPNNSYFNILSDRPRKSTAICNLCLYALGQKSSYLRSYICNCFANTCFQAFLGKSQHAKHRKY